MGRVPQTGTFLVPDDLVGRETHCGPVTITAEMVTTYARAVGHPVPEGGTTEPPALFCLTLRRDMMPDVPLPDGVFGVYGGHDVELLQPLRVGGTYRSTARIVDVYAKSGRSGVITVVVREVVIHDTETDTVAVRIVERQMIRRRSSVE